MNLLGVVNELPLCVETRLEPGELGVFRLVGYRPGTPRRRHLRLVAALTVGCLVLGLATTAGWQFAYGVIGVVVGGIAAWHLTRFVQASWLRSRERPPDACIGVAITTHRVLTIATEGRGAPVVSGDRARSELRSASVGMDMPFWISPPMPITRFHFQDGSSLDISTPQTKVDGMAAALRLAGVPAFDLEGRPMSRAGVGPADGPVATTGPAVSTTEPAAVRQDRSKVRRFISALCLMLVALFLGLWIGRQINPWGLAGYTQSLASQCAVAVAVAADPNDVLTRLQLSQASSLSGQEMTGVVEIRNGNGAPRSVAFTCIRTDDGMVATLED